MAISSKCINSGVAGVTCVPNSQLFATGMNGDEDLGQDIIMKGKPFHYQQVAQASPPGYETVDDQAEKVSVLQTPNAGYRTTFYGQLHQLNKQGDPEPATTVVAAGPEKVSVLETPIAGTHTTFYNQMKHKKKTDPVSPEGMDKWVYQISKENSGNFPNTHGVDTTDGKNHPANGGFIGQHATKYGAEIMNTPEYYFN